MQSGYRALMSRFPEQKFSAIALCNNTAMNQYVIVHKLADIYLDGQFPTGLPSQKTI
jgi:hypothetical protein